MKLQSISILARAAAFSALLLAGVASGKAQTATHSASFNFNHSASVSTGAVSLLGTSNGSATTNAPAISIPQFDATLGTLTAVKVTFQTTTSTFSIQNTGLLSLISGASADLTLNYGVSSGTASANGDSTQTTSGSSLLTLLGGTLTPIPVPTLVPATNELSFANASDLAAFTGTGQVAVSLSAVDQLSVSTVASLLNGAGVSGSGTYAGTVTITYTYTVASTSGSGGSGSGSGSGGTGSGSGSGSGTGGTGSTGTGGSGTNVNGTVSGTGTSTVVPSISTQPLSQMVAYNGSATFSIAASGAQSYQWYLNGVAIAGATSSTLTVTDATAANVGWYTVAVTNSSGTVDSAPRGLFVTGGPDTGPTSSTAAPNGMVNASTRTWIGTGGEIGIVGFVVDGGVHQVLVRAVGPGLTGFNVSGALANPMLTIFNGTTQIAANTGWDANGNGPSVQAVETKVGAFSLAAGSADAAILITLPPGAYTGQLEGANGSTGIGLLEVYQVW